MFCTVTRYAIIALKEIHVCTCISACHVLGNWVASLIFLHEIVCKLFFLFIPLSLPPSLTLSLSCLLLSCLRVGMRRTWTRSFLCSTSLSLSLLLKAFIWLSGCALSYCVQHRSCSGWSTFPSVSTSFRDTIMHGSMILYSTFPPMAVFRTVRWLLLISLCRNY